MGLRAGSGWREAAAERAANSVAGDGGWLQWAAGGRREPRRRPHLSELSESSSSDHSSSICTAECSGRRARQWAAAGGRQRRRQGMQGHRRRHCTALEAAYLDARHPQLGEQLREDARVALDRRPLIAHGGDGLRQKRRS